MELLQSWLCETCNSVSKDLSKLYIMGQQILYNEAISVLFYTFLFNSLHKCNRAEIDAICLFSLSVYQRMREIRPKKCISQSNLIINIYWQGFI